MNLLATTGMVWLLIGSALLAGELPPAATVTVSFAQDVLPILKSRCVAWHD